MEIKRLQLFMHQDNLKIVKVTKVTRPNINSRKFDVCRIVEVSKTGHIIPGTAKEVLSDSLRRRYTPV